MDVLQEETCPPLTTPASLGLRPLVHPSSEAHICSLSRHEQRAISLAEGIRDGCEICWVSQRQMRNCSAPAVLQNSKLLAEAEGQLLEGFLHHHHKTPPCQRRQRDCGGWAALGGSPVSALGKILQERKEHRESDGQLFCHKKLLHWALSFHLKEIAFGSLVSCKEGFPPSGRWQENISVLQSFI